MFNRKKLIIEARINEYAMKDRNPNVPLSPEEIADTAAECREAGAAIVHYHPRGKDGISAFGYDLYREISELIRKRTDILIHPTLGAFENQVSDEDRLKNILQLAKDGLAPALAPLDMGSNNADMFDPESGKFVSEGKIYLNSVATLRYFSEQLKKHKVKPVAVVWNVSMLRTVSQFIRGGLIDEPAYIFFGLSAGDTLQTHPGTLRGLTAYLDFLPEGRKAEWTVCLYGGSLFPLAGTIMDLGGHISIGLGDYAYPSLGPVTNAELVRRVANLARDCEREVASPRETQEMLGML